MDELDKGLAISVTGPLRKKALADFHRAIKSWQQPLPPVEPLVLDFGLGDFRCIGLIEYWISNEVTAGYCGKYLFVFDGQTCPLHRHRTKHETFFLIHGRLSVQYRGKRINMRAGDVLPIKPGYEHSFTGVGPALLLELSMPCAIDDNYFTDRSIPIGGNYRPAKKRA